MELKLKMNHISYSILKSGTNCSEVSSGTTEITKLGTLWVRNTAETRTSQKRMERNGMKRSIGTSVPVVRTEVVRLE